VLSSCVGCGPAPDYECIETQDAVSIGIRAGYSGITFDSLVVRKDNKTIGGCIGSKTHKVNFPVNINAQLFLHGTLLQNLDFNMSANSILTFYDSKYCEMIDSTVTPSDIRTYHQWIFYLEVQQAMDNGIFIDSSRTEIACWMMRQMPEEDLRRCSKVDGGRGSGKHEADYCR
jgi:hypothetical protein